MCGPLVLVQPGRGSLLISSQPSIKVVFQVPQALAGTAEFVKNQVSPLDTVTDSVTEELLLLSSLQVRGNSIEVAHSQVVGGVRVTSLRGQAEPSHRLRLVLSNAEAME